MFGMVSSITPGPNNTMMLASGVNFGVLRSLPHLLGITIGFCVLVLATGLGLHAVFELWPVLQTLLRYGGGAYLLWLAWKLTTAGPPTGSGVAPGRPLGFWGAAAFQWVNPKAWVMALGAVSTFLPGGSAAGVGALLTLVAIFGLVNAPCVFCWLAFGNGMRSLLQRPAWLRTFNLVCAALLVASVWPMLAP